jgi:hypothetical protein
MQRSAHEASERIRSEAEQETALNQIARDVMHEVMSHLSKHPSLALDIDVRTLRNVVSLTGKLSHRTLQIFCQGPDVFQLDDRRVGFQTLVTEPFRTTSTGGRTITQSEMVREVLAWLKERGTGRAA